MLSQFKYQYSKPHRNLSFLFLEWYHQGRKPWPIYLLSLTECCTCYYQYTIKTFVSSAHIGYKQVIIRLCWENVVKHTKIKVDSFIHRHSILMTSELSGCLINIWMVWGWQINNWLCFEFLWIMYCLSFICIIYPFSNLAT